MSRSGSQKTNNKVLLREPPTPKLPPADRLAYVAYLRLMLGMEQINCVLVDMKPETITTKERKSLESALNAIDEVVERLYKSATGE